MQSGANFDTLRKAGQDLGRFLKILSMMVLWSCVGGVLAGLTTFFVYFLGLYIGVPVGAIIGVFIGMKLSLAEAACIFGLTAITWIIGAALVLNVEQASFDAFIAGAEAALAGVAVAIVAYSARGLVPEKAKIVIGIATSGGVFILAIASFLKSIYR